MVVVYSCIVYVLVDENVVYVVDVLYMYEEKYILLLLTDLIVDKCKVDVVVRGILI